MTSELSLLSAFLIGIAGSVHCVGMCGGVVAAFSTVIPKGNPQLPYFAAYNAGRILSYSIAGGIAGYLGATVTHQSNQGILWLQAISGVFLILLGLYLANWWRVLTLLERAGKHVWKVIQPLSKHFISMRTAAYALPYGMVWGWLPCGLVYSTLTWSMASGSTIDGALVMLFFGLGTLPSMLLTGTSAVSIKKMMTKVYVRQLIGIILMSFGLMILLQATDNI